MFKHYFISIAFLAGSDFLKRQKSTHGKGWVDAIINNPLIKLVIDVVGFLIEQLPLLFLLTSLYVLYHAAKYWAVCRLRYERSFSSEGVFTGDEVFLTERLFNNSPLPIFFVDINFHIFRDLKLMDSEVHGEGFMQPVVSRFHLMPYMEVTRTHRIICQKRGFFKLESANVYVKELRTDLRSPAALYVYPRVAKHGITSNPVTLLQGSENTSRRVVTDPFSFSGVRDYAIGDPFNLINFKATARSGMSRIKVNRMDYSSRRIMMIYLNFQTAPGHSVPEGYEETMECALSLSASLIYDALNGGHMAGLAANCRTFKEERSVSFHPVAGTYHMEEILRMLAQARLSDGMSFHAMMTGKISEELREAEVFVISAYIDSETDEAIRWLKRRGNSVTVINPVEYAIQREEVSV